MKILLLFLFFAASATAQGISLKKGMVMDSIPVNDTLPDTYSLFLPSAFDSATPMPAIFIFDEEGRGISAARMFRQAAEEQGYILVSANINASEAGLEQGLISSLLLIHEVTQRLPIDVDYISTAGFGDGAAIATSTPLLLNNVHGVIYIAGQSFGYDHINAEYPYLAIGMVGSSQPERNDLWGASKSLDYFEKPNQLYIFEGGKEWPPTALIGNAVGDLTLEAMRTGKRPEDPQLIGQLYQRDLIFAEDLIARNELVAAAEFLEKLEAKYQGLLKPKKAEEKLRQLKRNRDYKDQKEQFDELMKEQTTLMADLFEFFDGDVRNANYDNLGWWNYQKIEMERLRSSSNPMEAAMGARVLHWLEQVTGSAVEKVKADSYSLDSKLVANMIATIFNPQEYQAYKNIISLTATDGDYSTALFYLEELLKNGYSDLEALYDIEGTLGLKTGKEFNWLVKKYLGSSKYYGNATSLY